MGDVNYELTPIVLIPYLGWWLVDLGTGFQLKLDNNKFGWVSEPQGCNLVKPVHTVPG